MPRRISGSGSGPEPYATFGFVIFGEMTTDAFPFICLGVQFQIGVPLDARLVALPGIFMCAREILSEPGLRWIHSEGILEQPDRGGTIAWLDAADRRVLEAVSLKVAGRMLIQVHHGEAAKDRTVMLSPQLLVSHVERRVMAGLGGHLEVWEDCSHSRNA
jgi:hypothetical protein